MLDRLTASEFEPLVGTTFSVAAAHEPVTAELLEVARLRVPMGARRGPFSLTFCARTAEYLPQGVFALTHDRLGRLDVFLVPVGRTPDGLLLEAVFN